MLLSAAASAAAAAISALNTVNLSKYHNFFFADLVLVCFILFFSLKSIGH